MTEKGYFDEASFEKYINFLIDQLPPKEVDPRWRLLIFDGYGPHTMVYSTAANQQDTCCVYAFSHISDSSAT